VSIDTHANPRDPDSSLLEGLYQLAVNGHTQGHEFDQLTSEVYQRLRLAYAEQEGRIAAVFNRTAA